MALRFASSCSRLDYADLGQEWGAKIEVFENLQVIAGGGRNGMDAIYCGTRMQMGILAPIAGAATNEIVTHAACKWVPGTAQRPFFSIVEGSAHHLRIWCENDGSFTIRRGTSEATPIVTTTAGLIPANSYAQWGVHIKIDAAAGFVNLYKDGAVTPVFTSGPINTKWGGGAGVIGAFGFGYDLYVSGITSTFQFCDVCIVDMVNDGTGFHGYLGDVAVLYHRPSGAGASAGWTRGGTDSGSNAGQVDDTHANNETDYVSTPTVGTRDTYAMQDLLIPDAAILGVQWVASARKEGGGIGDIGFVVRHGGTDYDAAGQTLGATYAAVKRLQHQNPGTSSAWTAAGWNAIEAGYYKSA
jgi:hypothetical protein